MTEKLPGRAYLAPENCLSYLSGELSYRSEAVGTRSGQNVYGNLIYTPGYSGQAFWALTVMEDPFLLHFASVTEAANALKSIQRNWAFCPAACYRRASLIGGKLPYISLKPKRFPFFPPKTPIGLWTLLDETTMLASARTSNFFPAGTVVLEEDRVNPPSRAYLKLQEALVRCGKMPGPGDRCLDAGACPGGWTWVLRQLGASVTAVDRTELDARLMDDPGVRFVRHDAFTLKPRDVGAFDWVFSDVICYPPRLYEWVLKWLDSGLCHNMVCTIKMQGAPDWKTVDAFAAVPGSIVQHLNYNKHELTWIYTSG